MSNQLTTTDFSNLPVSVGSDDDFAMISSGTSFLKGLKLFAGKSKQVEKGLISPGKFGYSEGDNVTDLGNRIDILPLARRPKACDMDDKPWIVSYNVQDPLFKRIVSEADAKVKNRQYGPSFLVIERSTGELMEYFLGAKTHRAEAKRIFPFLPLTQAEIDARAANGMDVTGLEPRGPRPVTLTSKFVEGGDYSWWVPVVLECSTPFTSLPSAALIQSEIERFLNPPQDVQEDEDGASQRRAR